jgi:hypothetical protein
MACGSLPQWSEHYPIKVHHRSSNAHWVMRCFVTASDKCIKMQFSGMAASVMNTLTWRQQRSSKCTPPVIASTHQASHCSRTFTSLPALPISIAPASHCYNSIVRHPAGGLACNHWATARKTSQPTVTWLLMQRRQAGSQSFNRRSQHAAVGVLLAFIWCTLP